MDGQLHPARRDTYSSFNLYTGTYKLRRKKGSNPSISYACDHIVGGGLILRTRLSGGVVAAKGLPLGSVRNRRTTGTVTLLVPLPASSIYRGRSNI